MADSADLSDFDPIAGAVSLAQSAGDGSTVRSYDPTWRDRLGSFLIGDQKPTPERRNFVSGLVGSTGLGSTGMGAADLTPPGVVLGLQEAAQHRDPVGMALNLAAVLPIGKAVKAAEAVAPEVGNAMRGIIAYHGSPHSFDKFDLSKIGTGEGAQAYGHGLYFAENEGVARDYQKRLSDGVTSSPRWFLNGQEAAPFSPEAKAASLIKEWGPARASKFADKTAAEFAADPRLTKEAEFWKTVQDVLGNGYGKKDVSQQFGNLYQVRINADPAHFLDWNAPLSEQPQLVQELARNADLSHLPARGRTRRSIEMWREGTLPNAASEPTGNVLHSALTDYGTNTADNAALTDKLRQAGIPGIKYLDAGSRSAGEGSRNYVVFNHDLIDILRRYAFGGSVADDAMRIASSVRPGGHDNEL